MAAHPEPVEEHTQRMRYEENVREAAERLHRGELIAFPTESSFGLGCDALSSSALDKLFVLKGRRRDKPPPLLISDEQMLGQVVETIPESARDLIKSFWPGPLTLVLPARAGLPEGLVLDGGVGVRQSPHVIARELGVRFGAPITASSANRAGEPPAMTANAVRAIFPDLFVVEGECGGGSPSTVVKVERSGALYILREGAIAREKITLGQSR